MITTLKKFFDFCDNKNRRMFYRALAVGVFIAVCEAAKFPAIHLVLDGFLSDAISGGRILVQCCSAKPDIVNVQESALK